VSTLASRKLTPAPAVTPRSPAAPLQAAAPPLAPPAEQIPLFPVSWYRFADARELRKPVARLVAGRWLVGFRGEGGRATVMEGRCVHQGADLGHGRVTPDGCLRCPFHGWEFDAAGRCRRTPSGGGEPPAFARQRCYRTVERHGSVFFFSGSGGSGGEPTFDLPFLEGEDPANFQAARTIEVDYHAPWYVVMANAFDIPHFLAVHDRKLLGQANIEQLSPWHRRIRYRVEVVGNRPTDRFLRRFVGRVVDVEHTVWGGNVLTTRASFARGENVVMFINDPVDPQRCRMSAIVLRRRDRTWRDAFAPASLAFRRALTRSFLEHENKELGSVGYSPGTFVEADRPVVDFLSWIAAIPRTSKGDL
jgi:phenylpropionate dioxygenase-like ring-hydroxylating dioxygenase large terminal subunit